MFFFGQNGHIFILHNSLNASLCNLITFPLLICILSAILLKLKKCVYRLKSTSTYKLLFKQFIALSTSAIISSRSLILSLSSLKLKLDRYRKSTDEMMKPSILKSFTGFRPYMRLNEEEEEEDDEDGMKESNN